ncbi:CobW family GTP-binding protein [Fusibacter sp. JL216-2]|uniref:CobW family GTP-binding protein n=1 Tax=Fusibacter sp. JL216-2 TaxID=3071453 RepID=UPI003D343023
MKKPIKLYTVTGFLGAGKTSFLKHVLERSGDAKVGVIQNEFGKIGIDGDIIRKDGMEMIEINRGSIFCSCLQLSFIEALQEMADKNVDYLFVEGSGLADPSNMNEILEALHSVKPEAMDYRGAICIIDGAHFLDQLEEIETVEKQVRHAQMAIVNKSDLIEDGTRAKIHSVLNDLKSDIVIKEAEYGAFDWDFMKEDLMHLSSIKFDETSNKEENKPKTLHLTTQEIIDKNKLIDFIDAISQDCYRIKGFAKLVDGWQQVDVVGRRVDFKPIPTRDEETRLVFISKIGPQVIKPIFSHWEESVGTKMKLR